ncbi:hypothetical protein HOLleu_08608 [Holothuria leucospilota]|uniref:Uncharacterized protein n=1 Tax=Holothuria leucospilota TaxID=206669 RepID=A0A9Q1CJF1_HOLLE|nr:hypothetical protein HOLleu_08608 [Holothuria leucospilota]
MLIDSLELAKWQTPNTDPELHDVLSRMEKTMRAQETPNIQRKRRLEDKVDHLLKNEDVDDDVRAKLYQRALRRQRVHQKQIPSMKDVMSPVNDAEEHHVSDDAIMASVPTKYRAKAGRLLQFFKGHGITWNPQGELEMNDKAIKRSHVIDLVNDLMRHRQSFEPRGHDTLSHWLADLNILVGNPKRRKAVQRLRDFEEVYAVASHLNTPPQTPNRKERLSYRTMLTKTMEQTLHKIYYDVSHAAGYTDVRPLFRAHKIKHPSIRKQDVKAWLQQQNTYTLHKPSHRYYP